MGEQPWRVKYDGRCDLCGSPVTEGTPAVWDRASRTIRWVECPSPDTGTEAGVPGRSACAEHDRRETKRDAAIAERWGSGLVARVVRAVSDEPQSTRAWAIGAAGEEKLAAELELVEGLRMLHDRRVPGTRSNIDHILVSPTGVFVVGAKNNQGRIEIRDRGGLFRTDYRLTVSGRDCSAMADKMGWQVESVTAALADGGIDPLPPMTPVLCLLCVEWPLFRPLESFRGVSLESHRSIKRLVAGPTVLTSEEVDRIVSTLASRLPAQ